jgi:hypothetical protein
MSIADVDLCEGRQQATVPRFSARPVLKNGA